MTENTISRRSVMRAVGASAAAGTLGTSATAAEERVNTDIEGCEAERAYDSAAEVEELINEHKPFLRTLARRGIIADPRIEIDALLSDDEYLRSDQGARSWGIQYYGNHHATPHITIRRKAPQ